jgi:hypothetical protein
VRNFRRWDVLDGGAIRTFSIQNPLRSVGRPDSLQQPISLGKSVEGVIGLAHGADEAAKSVRDVLAWDGASGLVDLADGDLDGGVVVGLDDAVGGRALASVAKKPLSAQVPLNPEFRPDPPRSHFLHLFPLESPPSFETKARGFLTGRRDRREHPDRFPLLRLEVFRLF